MEQNRHIRLRSVDVMAGIAMSLVVIGHHLFPFMPRWYERLYAGVYLFHMPLFIAISGFLIRYSYRGVGSADQYFSYVWRKFIKFLPPFLVIGLLCIFAYNVGEFNIATILHDILTLLVNPLASQTSFLWYLYVLVILYALSPLVFKLNKIGLAVLFLLSLIPNYFIYSLPSYFCISYIARYFQYYVLGVIIAVNFGSIRISRPSILALCLVVFIAMAVYATPRGNLYANLATAYLSIPASYCLARYLKGLPFVYKTLEYVGQHCFSVYILHLAFIQTFALAINCIGIHLATPSAILYLLFSTIASISLSIMASKLLHHIGIKFA